MFAKYCGVPHAIACTSGTTALHLGIAALGLGPGDEVLLPTFTMIATINVVAYTGATPVLVDAEPLTWNMDLEQLEKKITPRTKLVIAVHTYGHPIDMDHLMGLAERYGFWVMEDAAEAHGATFKGRRAGSLGDLAAFSFYANKVITTGEGGMITTADAKIATVVRTLRDHAFTAQRHFWHQYRGYNYRITNLQAAIGVAQIEQLPKFVEARRRNADLYSRLLREVPGITTPPQADDVESTFWMYGVLVDSKFGMSRDKLRIFLAEEGIETRTFFIPMHLQPIYFETFRGQRYPVAEALCRGGFYYPSSSSLTEEQINYIVNATKRAYAKTIGESEYVGGPACLA
jgi:perosamine synthetase